MDFLDHAVLVAVRGVLPFMCADIVRLAILVAFPGISLLLPGFMR